MYEMVYCSIAHENISQEQIEAILKTARDFNSKNDITGCLLYYRHEFIQVLEGEEEKLRNLFAKITVDKRHSHIRMLTGGNKENRTFGSWNMAFVKLSKEDVFNIGKDVFIDNFIAFAELAEKPTFPTVLFWERAVRLLEK